MLGIVYQFPMFRDCIRQMNIRIYPPIAYNRILSSYSIFGVVMHESMPWSSGYTLNFSSYHHYTFDFAFVFYSTRKNQVIRHKNLSKASPIHCGTLRPTDNMTEEQTYMQVETIVSRCERCTFVTGHEYLSNLHLIRYLVIDEADRMLEKGHFDELVKILDIINCRHLKKVRLLHRIN